MKKVVKASKNSESKKYWAEVSMKVAIDTKETDEGIIADEVYDLIADALRMFLSNRKNLFGSKIEDFEWVDVLDISPDHHN